MACFAFPESHHRRIQSTNGLERFNLELRRRTRMVRIFPNADPCLRLATSLFVEQSEDWTAGRVYPDMGKLEIADAGTPTVAERVASMAA